MPHVACSVALYLSLCAATHPAKQLTDARDQVAALHALFDSAWERSLREDPVKASRLVKGRHDDLWPDLSMAAQRRVHELDRNALDVLRGIDSARLPLTEQLNYTLFEQVYVARVTAYRFKPHAYAVALFHDPPTIHQVVRFLSFDRVADYENWVARLRRIDAYVDGTISLLRDAIRDGQTQSKVIMAHVPAQIALHIVNTPQDSPFYAPFQTFPDSVSTADRERLRAAGAEAIARVVIPAYQRYRKFFVEEYLPRCRDEVGLWARPDGDAYYRYLVEFRTTTRRTADEIHALGLAEVARIRAEMNTILRQVNFPGSLEEFFRFLRTDGRFYFTNPHELFQAYAALTRRIDPELPKLFSTLPRTPYGVRPIPAESAPYSATAFYQSPALFDGGRAGYYYVNLSNPQARPKFEMEALTLHEAMPGHHLQFSLVMEQSDWPLFRRDLDSTPYTAYVEGWALYAESLGEALGLYQDSYSKFGRLNCEISRAARLVVDTGLHQKHWSREQAIGYFKSNTAKSETDIVSEIDRYIAWPGQALAYKIGEMTIRQLRAEAEHELGDQFDIRTFHDAVLATGPVSLERLEHSIRAWVERERDDPGATRARDAGVHSCTCDRP